MSNHIGSRELSLQLPALPARTPTADVGDGVPTEIGDRRAISIFAMFALDEPEDAKGVSSLEDGGSGIVAFLPQACATLQR